MKFRIWFLLAVLVLAAAWPAVPQPARAQAGSLQSCPGCRDVGWLDGYVYDYDLAGTTCSDATVHVEPGDLDVAVDASGYYTVSLAPLEYAVTASAGGYPRPDGPYAVTVSDASTSRQDLVLARPDVSVEPLALSELAIVPHTATQVLSITNNGSFTLAFEIREINVLPAADLPPAPAFVPQSEPRSLPLLPAPEIEVEPQLLAELRADETGGYLVYFRERPDLAAAHGMGWIERGRFVVAALQETANHSQARVRAYLDAQGADYRAYWIDNLISVRSSTRSTFEGLLNFPEIEALRARRHPILYEPVDSSIAGASSRAVEDNIHHVEADRVWTEYGITGQGIVVANIDTGVRYTHQAVVDRYRGNLGNGNFDHNHNWWDPALGGSESVPNDYHSHGSHTMGTMLGDDGGGNQIGMAPGATWLACQAFELGDDELLECGQFLAAPWDLAGANADPDLRPHIINNSWGDCLQASDHWYDGVIDSWHALGIYPVFSNGNTSNCGYPAPPGCNTVGNPARLGNVTGVGSTGQSNGLYASHSNWGPTDDPDTVNPNGYPDLKPQVVAPGVNIRSAYNVSDTSYGGMTGTSMSAPHVSGLVALIWSAAPCLVGDYATTESIIQDTATPVPYDTGCGGEGPGNLPNMATGWGEINAYDAVQAAVAHCDVDRLEWVETDIVSGTLDAGQEQAVEVTFTCTPTATQESQPLEGILRILHDDPCQGPVDVHLSFLCIGLTPMPTWEKEVWINGSPAFSVEGPHAVRPGDAVTIVDRAGAIFSQTITSTLTEEWSVGLGLVEADAGGVGTVQVAGRTLTWSLDGVAPNALYPITKTFQVQYGDWMTAGITETYLVQGAEEQLPGVDVLFERQVLDLDLDKDGPATARSGQVISLTLTITSDGEFWGTAALSDSLPAGLTFAGGLTSTHGLAWEEANTVYWSNAFDVAPPRDPAASIEVGVLSPDDDPLQDLVDLLNGMGGITAQRITGDLSSLTLADLAPYRVVVTTNNNMWSLAGANPNVGDRLADYVDAGGKVIMANFAWDDPAFGWQLEGRLMDEAYTPYRNSTGDRGGVSLGSYDADHPVMQGVDVLTVTAVVAHQVLPLETGATRIADWADGTPCAYAQGTDVVGYNFLLDWANEGWPWQGDLPVLLENSIHWLLAHARPPLPPEVTITFDVGVEGEMGQVVRNVAELDWGYDGTDDVHEVTVDGYLFYSPVLYKNYLP